MICSMEKERELFHRLETEQMMAPEQQAGCFRKWAKDGTLVLLEDRENPIHSLTAFPTRWENRQEPDVLRGSARPGEYYMFQAVVYRETAAGPISLRWAGDEPAPHCFNLSGTGCDGKPFTKEVALEPGKLRVLWFGVDFSEEFRGEYAGTLFVQLPGLEPVKLMVQVTVAGEPLEDRGDSEPWRHSRLRWLDSTLAMDDGITAPYIPLRRKKNRLWGLANRITLKDTGLPSQLESRISPTLETLSPNPRPVLADGIRFGEAEVLPEKAKLQFIRENEGVIRWESAWTAGKFDYRCCGSMEYDGYQEYQITVTAREEAADAAHQLEIPYLPDTAAYWMGLGQMGGFRKGGLNWKWDVSLNQDTLWMGDVSAGLMVRLKGLNYRKPYMLIYYHLCPLALPDCWDNGGQGGVRVSEREGSVVLEAYTGPRHFAAGESVTFAFDLAVTPVKPLDKREHWLDHYYHAVPENFKQVSEKGANIINIHHAHEQNPFINYPFLEAGRLADFVESCHQNGLRAKLYYTVKEMTVHMTEFWAMKSLDGEIFPTADEPGKSFQGDVPEADAWMERMLGKDYITAWRQKVNHGCYHDAMEASVLTAPMSRFNNYFLEGLRWLLENTGIDGLYFDDVAFDRSIMKRIRKILDRDHPRCTIDLHSWNYFANNTVDNSRLAGWANSMNLYIDNFAFIDRLWFGEGFDYDVSPDSWLVEMSGIPFGMMGEMLQDGGNVWRGMVFGMTNRLPNPKDPSGLWTFWTEFGMADAVMLGWWNPACPVKTDCPDIKATVYRRPHQCLIALGSWAGRQERIRLEFDWEALGLDPEKAVLEIPGIPGFQEQSEFPSDGELSIPSGGGLLLTLRELMEGR